MQFSVHGMLTKISSKLSQEEVEALLLSDTGAFSSIWDEIVKFGVISRMWEVLGMYQDAQYWQARYEAGVARMLSNNKDKTGGIVSIGAVNNF